MNLADLAYALSNGKEVKRGDSYSALCPAHNDTTPSLSLSLNSSGKVLFHCHVGCSKEAVLAALKARGLWEGDGAGKDWKTVKVVPPLVAKSKPNITHPQHGKEAARWEYKNRAGETVGWVYRFNEPGGGKVTLPLTWQVNAKENKGRWGWRAFPEPRPLYGAHLLDDPDWKGKPVLIVEGEKTAEAARLIFPDNLVMTWPGGSGATEKACWEDLKGRDVTIWPDADKPGLKAAMAIGEVLYSLGVVAKVVQLPIDDRGEPVLPKAWDLADEPPKGVDVKALLGRAVEFRSGTDAIIEELNAKMAVTMLGGKTVIIWEKYDELHRKIVPTYSSRFDMTSFFANRTVVSGRKEINIIDYWMGHPQRRSYENVVFEPEKDTKSSYNLWRGFTYEPDPTGDWSLLEEHLRTNVAKGDESLYRWVVAWFASIIQHPASKVGTSLAIRGKQGTGKTVVGQHFGALIRDHYVLVDDPRYVTGQFNSHMSQALLLQADEGFFAGDPRHVGRLKGLVTSPTNRIEPKGKDSFEINNYIRLMITSNAEWVVPTASEERRFAVLDCGDDKMQNQSFFAEMRRQMMDGGYGGLMHHLQRFDLSTTDPSVIPRTGALNEQKEHSLDSVQRFWYERLVYGEIWPGTGRWETEVDSRKLWEYYINIATKWRVVRPRNDVWFGKELAAMMPNQMLKRVRITVKSQDEYGVTTTNRPWGYRLPPLDDCRKSYAEALGVTLDWGKDDPSDLLTAVTVKGTAEDDVPF